MCPCSTYKFAIPQPALCIILIYSISRTPHRVNPLAFTYVYDPLHSNSTACVPRTPASLRPPSSVRLSTFRLSYPSSALSHPEMSTLLTRLLGFHP